MGIKERTNHSKLASVPIAAEGEMQLLRHVTLLFIAENLFNMDETGLYWRRVISKGLTTAKLPGAKKDKSRISLVLCSNATGSEKLPLWLIGKSKKPRALRSVNLQALGAVWKASTKAWMNSDIMADWLRTFYRYIGSSRQVLLLMDNF